MTVDVVAAAILLAATGVVVTVDLLIRKAWDRHCRRPTVNIFHERISPREMVRLRERWNKLDADGQIRPEVEQ